MSDFATVYVGWNVWSVYQVKDLSDTNPMNWGLSRERRLRIWVEDSIRLGAPGTRVADSVDLKGEQVEILPGKPTGLTIAARKEQVSQAMVLDGPANLYYVRFFNRGSEARLVWPHSGEYLLNEVFKPDAKVAATSGPGPNTVGGTIGDAVQPVTNAVTSTLLLIGAVGLIVILAKR